MNKEVNKKHSSIEKKLCICGYAIIPVFFIALYFLMTETYEDILQSNSEALMTPGEIIDRIYNYIPRLGEFFQHIAVHYMTLQVSLGLDAIFRLVTAAIATGTVYLTTVFILGRKPRFCYGDMTTALGTLLVIMISVFSESFTYRFSYANNYVLGLLVGVATLALFRFEFKNVQWWKLVATALLGFAFGISTEIAPVAFLILVCAWAIVKIFMRKELKLKDLWAKYRLQLFAIGGLIVGLAFFYLGGGLGERTNGGYATVYDYISPMGIFKDTLVTGYKLLHHVWYNIRYVFFAIPLMGLFIFVEASLFKKTNQHYLFWQIMLLAFCILFVGATSLIAVHDDLYPRFMLPVFIAILIASALFIRHVSLEAKISEKTKKITATIAVALGTVLIIDTAFAFALYNITLRPMLEAIQYNPGEEVIIGPTEGSYTMIPSPIFSLKQLPPFDWGPSADYAKFGL